MPATRTGTPRGRDRIKELLQTDVTAIGHGTGWRLVVADTDLTERIASLEWGTDEGPAIVLDADVVGELGASLENERVMLDLVYDTSSGAYAVRQFTGWLLRPVHGTPLSKAQAASSGYWLQRMPLGEHTPYTAAAPDLVMADALGRAPYSGAVEVEPVGMPLFTRVGSEAFRKTDSLDNVVESVQQEVPYVLYDTPTDGCDVLLERSLAEGGDPEWTFEVGRDIHAEDFSPERQGESFAEVWVARQIEGAEDGQDPVEILASVPVPGSKAPDGAVMIVESSDYSSGAVAAAISTAYDEASAIAYGRYAASFPTAYVQPFLRRSSIVAVREPGRDGRGRYTRTWMCLLSEIGGTLPEKRGRYGGVMEVVGREYEPVVLSPPERASGAALFPAWGVDWLHRPYFSDSLPWVREDGPNVALDVDVALEHGVEVSVLPEDEDTVVVRSSRG